MASSQEVISRQYVFEPQVKLFAGVEGTVLVLEPRLQDQGATGSAILHRPSLCSFALASSVSKDRSDRYCRYTQA